VFPNVPFVGMEPAVKPAARLSSRGVIGVLATDATFQGELYASVVNRHAADVEIVATPGRGLVHFVERGDIDGPELRSLLASYIEPMVDAGVDTIVLGCTHYPFLLPTIRQLAGDRIHVIDPAPAVARQVARVVEGAGDATAGRFATTGSPVALAGMVEHLLGFIPDPVPEFWQIEDVGSHAAGGTRRSESAGRVVSIVQGDLTQQHVDAVVNAANGDLAHGGGVAGAIVQAGGSVIQEESDSWVAEHGPVGIGEAAVTSAGAMPSRHVIHVVGPVYREGQANEAMLGAAVSAALDAAVDAGDRSVALPAISAGIFGYPKAEATRVIVSAVVAWLQAHPGSLTEIRLVGYDAATVSAFNNALDAKKPPAE
jgi:O-acetyl-ADP-ribose deacetylase (regulator of RNase III)